MEELAFSADDHFIYGLTFAGGTQLVRIDRDTGVGALVGPTENFRGVTYDRVLQRLVGISNGAQTLWSIDPANGQAQVLSHIPGSVGWEGLAAVPVSSIAAGVGDPPIAPLPHTIRAYPNPFRVHTNVIFELQHSTVVDARVYDVAGREVRRLGLGTLPGGLQSVSWNGLDNTGRQVPSGVYFVRVTTPDHVSSAKVSIVR
jgi:hypothetical protein